MNKFFIFLNQYDLFEWILLTFVLEKKTVYLLCTEDLILGHPCFKFEIALFEKKLMFSSVVVSSKWNFHFIAQLKRWSCDF